jgi:hypothetical protein
MTIKINVNNSYIQHAYSAAYNALYEPAQREYDFFNNRELHDYWMVRTKELLCAQNKFKIISERSGYPTEIEFEDESDLIVFKLKYR